MTYLQIRIVAISALICTDDAVYGSLQKNEKQVSVHLHDANKNIENLERPTSMRVDMHCACDATLVDTKVEGLE